MAFEGEKVLNLTELYELFINTLITDMFKTSLDGHFISYGNRYGNGYEKVALYETSVNNGLALYWDKHRNYENTYYEYKMHIYEYTRTL